MLNCWVIMQPKKGNLLLMPFVAREMNMSNGKKSYFRLDPFLIGLLDNNRSAQLIKPFNVELLGNSTFKEG